MAKQIDGVIEAVRVKNGQITFVRAYERRGKSYSDCVVLDRKTLLERLQKGQNFFTGARTERLGSTFQIGKALMIVKLEGRELVATREDATRDEVEDALFF